MSATKVQESTAQVKSIPCRPVTLILAQDHNFLMPLMVILVRDVKLI